MSVELIIDWPECPECTEGEHGHAIGEAIYVARTIARHEYPDRRFALWEAIHTSETPPTYRVRGREVNEVLRGKEVAK